MCIWIWNSSAGRVKAHESAAEEPVRARLTKGTKFCRCKLTVMESDLSSSDAALRMLLAEDVELLD